MNYKWNIVTEGTDSFLALLGHTFKCIPENYKIKKRTISDSLFLYDN
ncbi:hypothetical protein [Tenacibaculum sp. 190524A02b]